MKTSILAQSCIASYVWLDPFLAWSIYQLEIIGAASTK